MTTSSLSRRWKGKLSARGPGDPSGVILPLDMVGDGLFDVAYTIPILIGNDNPQNLSLQIDTGSSDMWIASTSCSTGPCGQIRGSLYNPVSSTSTGANFTIDYLSGTVNGPIVWDRVEIGGYTIPNQALSAATSVDNEPLSSRFSGILGLALPLNSVIAQAIPPVTSNNPDGATLPSNLFGITPSTLAPAARFLSLSLQRPGSNTVLSYLGIGAHPPSLVPDPSKITYNSIIGNLFWKLVVQDMTVWVNGQPRPITLGGSNSGGALPEAILDSGVPLILMRSAIANGIYGALGVGPASDGQYYLPCDKPLNMTITLGTSGPIPLHPLDLTAPPPQDATSQNCVGLIQAADAYLNQQIGDMILGVPFLRNTYTVMTYVAPDAGGSFDSDGRAAGAAIQPMLGLLSLTNPTVALNEFNTVRVLGQPLNSTRPSAGSGNATDGRKAGKVGIDVLIGLTSFFGFCFLLFAIWWLFARRKQAKDGGTEHGEAGLKPREGGDSEGQGVGAGVSEDQLRNLRFESYIRKDRVASEYTMSSGVTRVDPEADGEFGYGKHLKVGSYGSKGNLSDSPDIAVRDSLVAVGKREEEAEFEPYKEYPFPHPPYAHAQPPHQRMSSEVDPAGAAVSTPLLQHARDDSGQHRDTYPPHMHRRSISTSALPAPLEDIPLPSPPNSSPAPSAPSLDEFGVLAARSDEDEPPVLMTGVGTAMRGGSRTRNLFDPSNPLPRDSVVGSIVVPSTLQSGSPITSTGPGWFSPDEFVPPLRGGGGRNSVSTRLSGNSYTLRDQ